MLRTLILAIFCFFISLNVWSRGGGGCFEEGTLVNTPLGLVKIETLKVGDVVYSRDKSKQQLAKVLATTKVAPDHYIEIKLPTSTLHVTDEHLIAIGSGEFKSARSLKVNDFIMIWHNHHWQPVSILALNKIFSKIQPIIFWLILAAVMLQTLP